MKTQVFDFRTLIKGAGLKHTKCREAVLRVLAESRVPLSIDALHEKLDTTVHRVTLYRILSDFVQKSLVYQTDFQTGKAYFEFQDTHHHHVVCTSCGYKEHIEKCVASSLKQVPNFSKITHHALEFFGTCEKCSNEMLSE